VKRFFEIVNGLFDSLMLAKLAIFRSRQSFRTLQKIVRKIAHTSAHSTGSVVTQWKEFTNYVFHTAAKSQTIEPVVLSHGNLFRPLLKLFEEEISRASWEDARCIAHLTSTRQMPYCGKATEKKSLKKFKEITSSVFECTPEHLKKMEEGARRIGAICDSIKPLSEIKDVDHLSVTSSGEFWHSIRKGGQAKATASLLEKYLTKPQTVDSIEPSPFGEVRRVKGEPLWRTLFRPKWQTDAFQVDTFGDVLEQLYGSVQLAGYDSILGTQILWCAWNERSVYPLLRAGTVPEMGNKARIVTVSEAWLNLLFSPFCHLLKAALQSHPSVYSSFKKSDQNWEALRLLMNGDPETRTLSSDLKDATNAIPFSIAERLVKGFCKGYGIAIGPYRKSVIDLIGPRTVSLPDGEEFLTSRGIMMGEAIAKPILTLLNLVVEEVSYLEFMGIPCTSDKAAPSSSWRAVHIGGDDHVLRGPRQYLDLVTNNHLSSGSIISPDKHGISNIMVKYTEKVLYVKNFKYKVKYKDLKEDELHLTPAVDSVKVRLLSKGESTLLKKDDRNVAIGKAFQLMRTLKYLKKDDPVRMLARDLFISRMRPLLPSKENNPKIWHLMFLPKQIGGLTLGFPEELQEHFDKAPFPIRAILFKMAYGLCVREEGRLLRKLTCNPAVRGVPYLQERTIQLQEVLEDPDGDVKGALNFLKPIQKMTWSEVSAKVMKAHPGRYEPNWIVRRAETMGIFTHHRFIERYLRGNIFLELLTSKPSSRKMFETSPIVDRYVKIRGELLEHCKGIDEKDIPKDFGRYFNQYLLDKIIFIDEGQVMTVGKEDFNYGGMILNMKEDHTLSEMAGLNAPALKVGRFS
jgi:hypothetical protein